MIVIKRTYHDVEALKNIAYDKSVLEDDGFDWLNVRVEKPWGHEVQVYRDKLCAVWQLHIRHHQQTSLHAHPGKVTLLNVIAGVATLETLNAKHVLAAGDLAVIEKGAFHRTKATDGAVNLYEMEWPAVKNDLVRLHDSYGRGQGYERVKVKA